MARSTNITHLKYNVVVMGDPYCGKSSIIERYTSGKYGPNYIQTIGSEFSKKELVIDDNPIMLYVYDTAGQEDMKTVIKSIYRNAQGILLVFDFSRKQTLDNIRQWIDLIQMKLYANSIYPDETAKMRRLIRIHAGRKGTMLNCDITPEMILVGNKVDLRDLQVTHLDAQTLAESLNIPFLEVSAKKNHNIDKAFYQLSRNIFENRRRLYPSNMVTSIRLSQEQDQKSSCCS